MAVRYYFIFHTAQYGEKNIKTASSRSFDPIPVKLYWDVDNHGGMLAFTFLASRETVEKNKTWNTSPYLETISCISAVSKMHKCEWYVHLNPIYIFISAMFRSFGCHYIVLKAATSHSYFNSMQVKKKSTVTFSLSNFSSA